MRRHQSALRFLALTLIFLLSACGRGGGGDGGGGGGNVFALNGGPVYGSVSVSAPPPTYTFNAVADTAYTVSTTTTSGSIFVSVYSGDSISGNLIGSAWNSASTTPLGIVSFVASVSGPIYVVVEDMSFTASGSTYTLEAYTGDLTIGAARSGATYNDTLYYSFDAVGGTAYRVQLTPQTGNVNIGAVNAKMSASVGSSNLAGTAVDSVTFLAPGTQRYYVRVDSTIVNSTFNVQVNTTTTDPDLRVVINSATSNGSAVAVNYTVYNNGLNAANTFGVTAWSDAPSAPSVGSTGEASTTHPSLAAGASVTGTLTIPNTGNSGTAYVIVDTLNAIPESDETNNVGAGKTWQKPLLAPQSFDFEDGLVPAGLTMSGNANWAVDSTTGSASSRSLKAGAIGNSQSSCFAVSVANAVSVSFDYAVSSESYYDDLRFYIDGVQTRSASGTVVWTPTGAISVNSGTHEYKWCYSKDYTIAAGSDTAWVDNIVFTPAVVDLQVAVNSAVSNGTNVTVNYTVNNAGTTASGPFAVAVWSNALAAPVVGDTGEGPATHTSLAAGASVTGNVTIANASASGTAYAIVDTANAVVEVNEANNVSAGKAWQGPPAAPQSFNFEDGLVPGVLGMSGNAAWVNVAGGAGGSTRSLKAGTITDSQTTCVAVYVTNSSSVSFDYSVSSETSWDYLRFYIDGVQKNQWSGTVAWTSSGVVAAGTTGTHEYKWCYTKDVSCCSAGSDTAWIDNIVIN